MGQALGLGELCIRQSVSLDIVNDQQMYSHSSYQRSKESEESGLHFDRGRRTKYQRLVFL
jgi:hypothetical protein